MSEDRRDRRDRLAPAVSGFASSGVGPKVDLSSEIRRQESGETAPRCGHHRTPLVYVDDVWKWRCRDCFPDAFPTAGPSCVAALADHAGDVETVQVTVQATGATGAVPLCARHRGVR